MTPQTPVAVEDLRGTSAVPARVTAKPLLEPPLLRVAVITLWAFVAVPFLALAGPAPARRVPGGVLTRGATRRPGAGGVR